MSNFKELVDIFVVMTPAIQREIATMLGTKVIRRAAPLAEAGIVPGLVDAAANDVLEELRAAATEAAAEGGR